MSYILLLYQQRHYIIISDTMAKNSKEEYKEENDKFLTYVAQRPDVKDLYNGILYRVIASGSGKSPNAGSVVSVFYKVRW